MNIDKIRNDFPILQEKVKGKPIIYMDSACVSLRPKQVIEKTNEYYAHFSGCAGRSAHQFARKTTEEVNKARETISNFIHAKKPEEIIFTRNTTEGINIISHSFGLQKGDAVLLSDKEHNSMLIPFLQLKKKGIDVQIYEFGNLDDFKKKINDKVKLVATLHTSNLDGTSQDIRSIAKIAHEHKAMVLIDGAQAAPHKEINMKDLDVDFYAFSGHKMLGPSGIGALYGKKDLLEQLEPYNLGGSTVRNSFYDHFEIDSVPMRFEAGLQDYSGIMGFSEAIKYLKNIGMDNIQKHEKELNEYLFEKIKSVPVTILGGAAEKRGGITSFTMKGLHVHDVASLLDASANIMIRSGQHCVHSWFNAHKIDGSARASLYLYNTKQEVDVFAEELAKISKMAA